MKDPEVLPCRIVTIGSEDSIGGFFPQGLAGNLRRCMSGMHQHCLWGLPACVASSLVCRLLHCMHGLCCPFSLARQSLMLFCVPLAALLALTSATLPMVRPACSLATA